MTERFDRVVIGGGAMGLATTWQLARRGVKVLMLERFASGHARGASHGATRNMNNAYSEDHYLDLYDEALRLYRDLASRSGKELLVLQGLVTHGAPGTVFRSFTALRERGAFAEMISAQRAAERWQGMRFDTDVLVNRDAGRINASAVLETLAGLAERDGAKLRYEHRVLSIELGSDAVMVAGEDADGQRFEVVAERVVLAAGAWSAPLLEGLVELPRLTVTEEHPAHFSVRQEYRSAAWPSFNHFLHDSGEAGGNKGNIYGMLTPGEGVKVGFHLTGEEIDPDNRPFRATDAARQRLKDYVSEWFPGLDSASGVEISCTYTSTVSERFVLDQSGLITVGAGFSGMGFKFVPAIGRILADATMGERLAPDAFRLDSHR